MRETQTEKLERLDKHCPTCTCNKHKHKYPNYHVGQKVWLWGDIRAVVLNPKFPSAIRLRIVENFKGLRDGDIIDVVETRNDPQMRPRKWGQRRGEY